MKLSIFKKIMALSVFIALSMTCVILATAMYFVSQGFYEDALRRIRVTRDSMSHILGTAQNQYKDEAVLAADNADFVQAVAKGDAAEVQRHAAQVMQQIRSDFMTVSDAQGTVIARGHADQKGDSVLNQATVQRALKGETTAGIVAGTVVPLSIRAGTPILHQGKVIGTLSVGVSLVSEKFVDNLKNTLDVEVTVFTGDTRLATTIVNAQGKRAVGTKMDNPAVLRTVLEESQIFIDKNIILGKAYQTAYWPIKDMEEKTIGMWFVGLPQEEANRIVNRTVYLTLAFAGLALPLVLGLGFLLARAIAKPLSMATGYASKVAAGQLDGALEVQSHDEVGVLADALRSMVASLKEKIADATSHSALAAEETAKAQEALAIAKDQQHANQARQEAMFRAVEQLQGVTGSVTAVSEQLAAKISETLQGAELQNGRTNETANAMTQMNEAVLDITRSASQASEVSISSRGKAVDGAKIVETMSEAIRLVSKQSETLSHDMDALGLRAEEIGHILGVISDIADQTNLLALNAAIEAARAGDAGRGFAVVADEVRKLAEKTMTATKEVGDAISGIQKGTRENIAQLADAVSAIEGVTRKAQEAGDALQAIVSLSDSVSTQVASIAAASEKSSAISEQINQAVNEVRDISGEIRTGMQASSEDVGNLTTQTQNLRDVIAELQKAIT